MTDNLRGDYAVCKRRAVQITSRQSNYGRAVSAPHANSAARAVNTLTADQKVIGLSLRFIEANRDLGSAGTEPVNSMKAASAPHPAARSQSPADALI